MNPSTCFYFFYSFNNLGAEFNTGDFLLFSDFFYFVMEFADFKYFNYGDCDALNLLAKVGEKDYQIPCLTLFFADFLGCWGVRLN